MPRAKRGEDTDHLRAGWEKAAANRAAGAKPRAKRSVTLSMVRAKCLDCLCGIRYDCKMGEKACSLYPAMP